MVLYQTVNKYGTIPGWGIKTAKQAAWTFGFIAGNEPDTKGLIFQEGVSSVLRKLISSKAAMSSIRKSLVIIKLLKMYCQLLITHESSQMKTVGVHILITYFV